MSGIGTVKTDTNNVIEVKPKLHIKAIIKNEHEATLKINYTDTLKSTSLPSGKHEIRQISIENDSKSKLSKSIEEGVKIKGTLFGLEYMGAGTALGVGYSSKFLNIVPEVAKNAPTILGVTQKYPKVAVIGLSAGVVGTTMGALKGSADGVLVNYAPSKSIAMVATSITSALVATPTLKINIPVGIVSIGIGATFGALYGSYVYDKVKNESPKGDPVSINSKASF